MIFEITKTLNKAQSKKEYEIDDKIKIRDKTGFKNITKSNFTEI